MTKVTTEKYYLLVICYNTAHTSIQEDAAITFYFTAKKKIRPSIEQVC